MCKYRDIFWNGVRDWLSAIRSVRERGYRWRGRTNSTTALLLPANSNRTFSISAASTKWSRVAENDGKHVNVRRPEWSFSHFFLEIFSIRQPCKRVRIIYIRFYLLSVFRRIPSQLIPCYPILHCSRVLSKRLVSTACLPVNVLSSVRQMGNRWSVPSVIIM